MADRYAAANAASFYEQQQRHQQQQQQQTQYAAQPYRTAYSGYAPYGYAPPQPYGQTSHSSYMSSYYAGQYDNSSSAYRRYASYASPHYSQPGAMFTPAGQQLIPSSVLHYPPRQSPYAQPVQPSHSSYASEPSYAGTPYAHAHAHARAAAAAAYQASASASAYHPHYAHNSALLTSQRSMTPAPNRTVLPPNYLEPLRSYADQLMPPLRTKSAELTPPEPLKPDQELEAQTRPSSPPRLTTSPPLISATGTDSGISNCSTRARSDSSQSTPVYSSEYPVNMSVESASCVSYHCPADSKDYEEEQSEERAATESNSAKLTSVVTDDISVTTAMPASTSTSQSPALPNDKPESEVKCGTPATSNTAAVVKRAEINLVKPKEVSQDAVQSHEQQQQQPEQQTEPQTNQMSEAADSGNSSNWSQQPLQQQSVWCPSKRRPCTPPVPQNSPVGYGSALAVPASHAPLGLSQPKAQNTKNLGPKSRSRIIECDLIPSKKSKRKASKTNNESSLEAAESTVREQITDIKPLPGFQQAFGSTEIGRFSETFLQTPETAVLERSDSHLDDYAAGAYHGGYYDGTLSPHWSSATFDEHNNYSYNYNNNYNHNQMGRNRLRTQGYGMPDYMSYERYAAVYGAGRARYGEIRCNGY